MANYSMSRVVGLLRCIASEGSVEARRRAAADAIAKIEKARNLKVEAISHLVANDASSLADYLESLGARLEQAEDERWILQRVAEFFAKHGEAGTAFAKAIREDPELDLWAQEGVAYPPILQALSETTFAENAAELAEKLKQPALSEDVLDAIQRGLWEGQRKVDGSDIKVGTTVVGTLKARISKEELRATRSLAAHRLIRWLVRQAFLQRAIGSSRFETVSIAGGYKGLAKSLRLKGNKAAESLKRAVRGISGIELPLPLGNGTLFSVRETRSSPGRPAVLNIKLGDALLPEYVVGISKRTRSGRAARRLVPVPMSLPPMTGHLSSHSSQASFQVAMLRQLRASAQQVAHGVRMDPAAESWMVLAERCGVPRDQVAAILEAWTEGTADAPPFLQRTETGLTLSEHYAAELECIIEAGKLELDGAARQASSRRSRARTKR